MNVEGANSPQKIEIMTTEIEKLSIYANNAQIDDAIARDKANGLNIHSEEYLSILDHVFLSVWSKQN